jgi:hypothetical protein
MGQQTTLRPGERADIPDVGNCSNIFEQNASILTCDSVEVSPANIRTMFEYNSRKNWGDLARNDAFVLPTYYPRDAWLSPLHHGRSSSFGVPSINRIVAPVTEFHTALIDYTIPNVDLNRYVVHDPRKAEAPR